MRYDYKKLLHPIRSRSTTITGREPIEEYYSDRSRIIYSSSFRRLQQKAQVFSLEPNSSVRTRLTHSIEVSDIGRSLASKIVNRLIKNGDIDSSLAPQIVAVVENACLLHDIGNPPFGHFGETAIREWSRQNLEKYAIKADVNFSLLEDYKCDFYEFDGNPQGLRTVLRLHCEQDENGLNLTYPTILSGIKYVRAAGDKADSGLKKKAGYFLTEKSRVFQIYDTMQLDPSCRYPLAYIMEAADDLSYCLSDISDGIEKKVITAKEFIEGFQNIWQENYPEEQIPIRIPKEKIEYFNVQISVPWSNRILSELVDFYIKNHKSFFAGIEKELIHENGIGRVLKTIKEFSRKELYRSPEAENIELSGYAVITGLLNHYSRLLALRHDKFALLTNERQDPSDKDLDLEWRLYNRISKRCIKSYKFQLAEFGDTQEIEWWLRVHLLLDHISGMTDAFALETYQMLEGIKINI